MTRITKTLTAAAIFLLLLGALPADARTTAVRFYDSYGAQITDQELEVQFEDGTVQRYLPGRGGVYYVEAGAGRKVAFRIAGGMAAGTMLDLDRRGTLNVTVRTESPVQKALQDNDLCEDARAIAPGGSDSGDTTGNTPSAALDPACLYDDGPDVWYTVLGNGNVLEATTCVGDPAGSHDSKLGVYCDGCDTLTCIAANDDGVQGSPLCDESGSGAPFASTVTWCSTAGAEYLIQVSGFSGQTGPYTLEINDSGTACPQEDDCTIARGACCTDGPGTESECIEVTQAECDQAGPDGGLFLGGGTSCDDVDDCVPLFVSMDSMSAHAGRDGVTIRWTTATEIDTVGFRVLREIADGREKRIDAASGTIGAIGIGTTGASYEFVDSDKLSSRAKAYYIDDIDIFGRTTRHGPIAIQPGTRTANRQR